MKKPNKKFDLKNITHEQKVKIIGISIIAVVAISMISYGYFSGEEKDENIVEEMTNPEAELSEYNTKLAGINAKENTNLAGDLENTFSNEIKEEDKEEINFDELDRQIASFGKSNSEKEDYTPVQNNNSKPQNNHNVYGDYQMWQTNEPKNSKIEYSNKRPVVVKSTKETFQNQVESSNEIVYKEPVIVQKPISKQQLEPQQVKAKLISQGYAQTGRNLTFILLEPAEIAGKKTKKGQLITGTAQEQNNRLLINFAGIKIDDRIYPVNIELLGSDGGKGLPIAGGEDTYNNVEGEIRNQAGGLVNRIPVVGGVISSVTRSSGNNNRNQSIKLNSNIKCYLMIY